MAASYIEGVQSQGVGTSLKHYAANNQEFERMATSSNVDERTLSEIYLPAFEIAVKEARPWTVMSAYNLVNGVYASEHKHLLQEILRDKWGFAGLVVSDWGGVNDRVEGLRAGTDLEMPGSGDYNRNKIVEAVKSGTLSGERLDESAAQLVALALKTKDQHRENTSFDVEEHHALAREAGAESIVLLKNANNILPLHLKDVNKIAVIGAFAKIPVTRAPAARKSTPPKFPMRTTN